MLGFGVKRFQRNGLKIATRGPTSFEAELRDARSQAEIGNEALRESGVVQGSCAYCNVLTLSPTAILPEAVTRAMTPRRPRTSFFNFP